jgi:hypothetical protein
MCQEVRGEMGESGVVVAVGVVVVSAEEGGVYWFCTGGVVVVE